MIRKVSLLWHANFVIFTLLLATNVYARDNIAYPEYLGGDHQQLVSFISPGETMKINITKNAAMKHKITIYKDGIEVAKIENKSGEWTGTNKSKKDIKIVVKDYVWRNKCDFDLIVCFSSSWQWIENWNFGSLGKSNDYAKYGWEDATDNDNNDVVAIFQLSR